MILEFNDVMVITHICLETRLIDGKETAWRKVN